MTAVLEGVALGARIPGTGGRTIYETVSLTVHDGESVAIIGRSGAGKSTLLATLGLLQPPHRGEVRIHGRAVSRSSDSQRARLRNREMGFVFQDYALVPQLDVVGNLELPLSYGKRMGAKHRRSRIAECLELVGMAGTERRRPASLSGGEQQRVAIARALVAEPSIILADEPTGALDVATGDDVLEVLRSSTARAGSCLVIVTHDPVIAARADRALRLSDGGLETAGIERL